MIICFYDYMGQILWGLSLISTSVELVTEYIQVILSVYGALLLLESTILDDQPIGRPEQCIESFKFFSPAAVCRKHSRNSKE